MEVEKVCLLQETLVFRRHPRGEPWLSYGPGQMASSVPNASLTLIFRQELGMLAFSTVRALRLLWNEVCHLSRCIMHYRGKILAGQYF